MSGELRLSWQPPGPVAAAAHRTLPPQGGTQILNGPIGSGKTTERMLKGIELAAAQQPSTVAQTRDDRGRLVPVRKVKMTVVRDNYRQLWRSTLPSWWKRIPRDAGTFTGAENAPCAHEIKFQLPDGSIVDFRADFIAIGENAVEDVMRGYEPTFWYLNELDLLSKEVLTYALGRAGRFPDMREGGPTWRGVLADCNAPEFDSWLYQDIFAKTPTELAALGVQLFMQPSGLSPQAENVANLPPDYYRNAARGQPEWYVARMLENRPGYSRAGKPVHPEFKDAVHVPRAEIQPMPGVALIIGLDPRTRPSAAFMQRRPSGQRCFIDELQGEQNMGPRRFGKLLADLIHDRYGFLRGDAIRGVCDPSAQYGADKEDGEQDWLQIVGAVAGIRIDPAPSNNLDLRREALKKPLMELIDGEPAIQVSPRCARLRAGLNSGFRYRKLNVSGAEKFSEEVEKNDYADICEAAEYACLTDGAELEIRERRAADAQRIAKLAQSSQHDWDPFAA